MEEGAFSSYERETPIVKLVYDTYVNNVKDSLDKHYFPGFPPCSKWRCFSDYSFDANKPNDIITFTLLPHVMDMQQLADVIKRLAPKEIKKTKLVNSDFLEFIKHMPFVTFSFVIQNHKHLFYADRDSLKESMLYTMKHQLNESIPRWTALRPHLADYHADIAGKIKQVINLIENDKKIRILKNLFLTTSIGSVICTQFANRTNAEIVGWFPDRDEIHDVADNFAGNLFSIQFAEHLENPDCKFVIAPSGSKDEEWYGELIKIPDYITGALADYNFKTNEISHDKFEPIIKKLIVDNDKDLFVFRLTFTEDSKIECTRVNFQSKTESV